MTDSELIVLFALAMLALALLAVAVDWVGKPIHRRFVPKIFRYPDELATPPDPTRTTWSDDTFTVPENPPDDQPIAFADGSTEWSDAALVIPEPTPGSGPALFDQLAAVAEETHARTPSRPEPPGAEAADDPPGADTSEPGSPPAGEQVPAPRPAPARSVGWRPGQFVFNLTRSGEEPSAEVVRKRFWRNVGESDHAKAFGPLNAERLAAGRPPARRNPRRGSTETMRLPVDDFATSGGRAPSPAWPDDDVDPFDQP